MLPRCRTDGGTHNERQSELLEEGRQDYSYSHASNIRGRCLDACAVRYFGCLTEIEERAGYLRTQRSLREARTAQSERYRQVWWLLSHRFFPGDEASSTSPLHKISL